MIFRALIIATVLLCHAPVCADQLTPQKAAAIAELMELTGESGAQMGQMMSQAFTSQITSALKKSRPDLPGAIFEVVKEEIDTLIKENIDGLLAHLHPIYHKYYTLEEITGLIDFYKTPLGAKAIRSAPQIMQEGMVAGRIWGEQLAPVIQERIRARLQKEGVEL